MKAAEIFLKWFATGTLILGAILTTMDLRPINIWMFNAGNTAWLIVGLMWREWSLVVLNLVLIAIYGWGLIFTFG